MDDENRANNNELDGQHQTAFAIFAGGCFWCMVQPFAQVDGVREVIAGYTGGHTESPTYEEVCEVISGYIGGHTENPTYSEVCSGATGHYEAVRVEYDPAVVSYETLVEVFWRQIDPIDRQGQFADKGTQYRSAIFYTYEQQRQLAEESKRQLDESGKFEEPIATAILPAGKFYPAEHYHQDYYLKNPERCKKYKISSGREPYLKETWGNKGPYSG